MKSNARLQLQIAPDADERAKVLDATRSFIVQAPAGSGKTELLMQRYLTLLAHESVTTPESVLAITFTRKAAAEMRNRVLKALESANGPAPESAHALLSWELARKVMARDRAMGWNILQNPEQLEIRTVDSFCEKIANRTPLLAGLGRSPAIAEDFEPLYSEAAQRTLLMLGDEKAETREAMSQVLADQDNSFDRVQGLIVELLKRREQWGRLIGGAYQRSEEELNATRQELERALRDAIAHELEGIRQQLLEGVPAHVLQELLDTARYGAGNLEPEHALNPLRDVNQLPGASPDDLPQWLALVHFCLSKDRDLRKPGGYNVNMGFPADSMHRERKDACHRLIEAIGNNDYAGTLCAALSRVAKLPPPRYDDDQWNTLKALFRVLPLAVGHLRTVFAERGEVDFSEIALAAKAALGEEGHPTDLALHLGYKIQHLLVDEFQDTSLSQAVLLERLIQAWSPEMGATMFVVGDPMQSIYGFRQAEVTLFTRSWNSGFAQMPLEQARLTANFRSRPELVTWFNQTFEHVLVADNEVTGAVKYAPSEAAREPSQNAGPGFHSVASKAFEEEAARVIEVLQQELKGDAKSIALLVRSRSHMAHIAPALREAGIAFRSKEIDVLGERQTVRDLHAMTKALVNLADRTAWLTVLRGPWSGLQLEDLWTLCKDGERKTVWELLRERRGMLSDRAQKVLARTMPALDAAVTQRGRTSLRALVESLWVSLGGPAALGRTERKAKLRDVEAYLDLLQRVESCGEVDEKRLEQEISRLYTRPDASSEIRVEVMTIHGAKGLEFDVVILPGLNRWIRSEGGQLLNWRERIIGEERDLLLAPMDAVGTDRKKEGSIANYLAMLGGECSAEETKRLLYVAATRAKERLHLVTTMPAENKEPERGSLLSLLPAEVFGRFLKVPTPEAEDEEEQRTPNLSHRLVPDWQLPAAPEPLKFETRYPVAADVREREHTFERVQFDLPRIGTVTHRFLQQIGDEGPGGWTEERIAKTAPRIRALLLQQGIRSSELAKWEETVTRALRNTLAHDKGQWILKQRESASNEYGLTSALDGPRRSIKVDRTFVEGEVRWLIDYKTSDQEGTVTEKYLQEQVDKYRDDLAHYARVLRAMDGREVKGGLYFPLLQIWREVDVQS
ncbi:DNA helicase/exodeoxyribonuclease V, subunit A [Candidatus Koribacter versatilis Ellin345]|uniref:DNA 3'-5' helicase n=1 Tax=Koribacter versatilis (strain Ellin345) TaxID=204669 RepID=Q1IKH7_KORVE|nr:UvrD-helicase domain-containing protein [Candidatus Koribacter versatilis]ABF42623.1 DNA helicase/exodeoxyribonuclease V, subunit A [Candidatus Koribacter versatilis Ellin345]